MRCSRELVDARIQTVSEISRSINVLDFTVRRIESRPRTPPELQADEILKPDTCRRTTSISSRGDIPRAIPSVRWLYVQLLSSSLRHSIPADGPECCSTGTKPRARYLDFIQRSLLQSGRRFFNSSQSAPITRGRRCTRGSLLLLEHFARTRRFLGGKTAAGLQLRAPRSITAIHKAFPSASLNFAGGEQALGIFVRGV
jgi:hypothetical protein